MTDEEEKRVAGRFGVLSASPLPGLQATVLWSQTLPKCFVQDCSWLASISRS
jgi:hypothetical protein